MSLLKQIKSAKQPKPRRIVLYGVEGIGKSTWAAHAPSPIFIPTEDGINHLDVPTFPHTKNFNDVMNATYALSSEKHEFKTLVMDSADWFEKFIFKQVCDETGAESINDPYNKQVNYGKGYELALVKWDEWLKWGGTCRDGGMNIILIAHCHTPNFKDPSTESYNRYEPKIYKTISERLREWADEVFFATYKVYTNTAKEGFSERTLATGVGERTLKCCEMPSHKAKNRLGLEEGVTEISMKPEEYWNLVSNCMKGGDNGDDA